MEQNKHAPGPWNIEVVRKMVGMFDTGISTGNKESEANARLMASALVDIAKAKGTP